MSRYDMHNPEDPNMEQAIDRADHARKEARENPQSMTSFGEIDQTGRIMQLAVQSALTAGRERAAQAKYDAEMFALQKRGYAKRLREISKRIGYTAPSDPMNEIAQEILRLIHDLETP